MTTISSSQNKAQVANLSTSRKLKGYPKIPRMILLCGVFSGSSWSFRDLLNINKILKEKGLQTVN